MTALPRNIVDADGHIAETMEMIDEIASYMPPEYGKTAEFTRSLGFFPPLDQWHIPSFVNRPNAFKPVGPEGWLEFADAGGIEQAALYPSRGLSYGWVTNVDYANALCRAYNDWIYNRWMKHSSRFIGIGLIPMQDNDEAIKELTRIMGLGFKGAMLPSTGLKTHLGDPIYWPVYEAADKLGAAFALHGGAHSGMGLDQLNDFSGIHALGHPVGIATNFVGVVLNKVFDRFPNVRWGFLEGGIGWFIMALERLDGSTENFMPYNPDGRLFDRARSDESATDYVRRHTAEGRCYVGIEGEEPGIGLAIKLVGNRGLLFSSDFPHENSPEAITHELEELYERDDLTPEDKQRILRDNAVAFYRL